jgi:ElaB/YqjD/DUF883 family membrane-anchored ribosome-binding protein
MHQKDQAEPTAVEKLAMDIVELTEDVAQLRHRLDGQDSKQWDSERRARWEHLLATVQAAIDERVAHALQRTPR